MDSRYRWYCLLRVGSGVDRSRVGRDARLGHVGSLIVRAARRGRSHRRVGVAGLGGPHPQPAHLSLSSSVNIRTDSTGCGRRAAAGLLKEVPHDLTVPGRGSGPHSACDAVLQLYEGGEEKRVLLALEEQFAGES